MEAIFIIGPPQFGSVLQVSALVENEARPHTEAELQHFKKKKNTNGKSQMGFQMGGGRQCRNVLAQLLWGVYFESKAPTRHHEFALPRCCDCGAGNVRSAAECTRVHQPQWESLLRAFHPIPAFFDSILTFMKIKMRAAWNIFSLRLFQQVSEYMREWIIGKKTLSW